MVMSREDDATRPITMPPRRRCLKPLKSACTFRDDFGLCAKRITTCRWLEGARDRLEREGSREGK